MSKGSRQNWRSVGAAVVAVLGLLLLTTTPPARGQGNPNPGIIPVNKQYVKLSAEWWQWAFSFGPVSNNPLVNKNPLFDETGARACLGEQDPDNIFFLGGVYNVSGSATRDIKVPSGSRLFFPVLNVVWENVGLDPQLTVQQLYEEVAASIALVTELHASIDGRPVREPFSYRARSDPFCLTVPETDNIYQFFGQGDLLTPFACPAGFCICPAVTDGFWLLLTPLPVGQHTINFGGTFGPPLNFTLDITYNITVEPRGHYQGCT